MADPAQIEQELRYFLDIEDNIRKDDRIKYLMAIVKKHYELDKIDHTVNAQDFENMLRNAKSEYVGTSLPVSISGKELTNTETNYVLMIEAFISYLNSNKLLKRLVKFEYKRRGK